MQYQFDTQIAREYSLEEAVFIHNIYFWVKINAANQSKLHYHDGRYWTYNTMRGLVSFFEGIWSERQVQRIVEKCRAHGLIETGSYSENPRDRTLWYTTTETVDCIYRNRKMESTKSEDGGPEIGKCIKGADINTDSKLTAQAVVEAFAEICVDLPGAQRPHLTDKRRKAIATLGNRGYTLADLRSTFTKAQASTFCRGGGAKRWTATLDWLLQENNLAKVLEGQYDDAPTRTPPPSAPKLIDEEWV